MSKNFRKSKTGKPRQARESKTHLPSNFAKSDWYDNVVLHELDILGNDPEFVIALLKTFEKEGAQHVLDIKKSMYDDYLEYREHLHALKGSATELGATRLVEVCLEGEALKPYDMGSEKIEQMSKRIEEVFNRTVAALNNATTAEEDKAYPKKLPER